MHVASHRSEVLGRVMFRCSDRALIASPRLSADGPTRHTRRPPRVHPSAGSRPPQQTPAAAPAHQRDIPWCGSWCELRDTRVDELARPKLCFRRSHGGAEGTRTPDPLTARKTRGGPLRRYQQQRSRSAPHRAPSTAPCRSSSHHDPHHEGAPDLLASPAPRPRCSAIIRHGQASSWKPPVCRDRTAWN